MPGVGRLGRASCLFAVLLSLVIVGHAITLGGMNGGGLFIADQATGAPGPSVIGCDNFTGTTGSSVSGRSALVAAACSNRTWTVHLGTWTVQTNRAASNATTNANAN